MEGGGGLFVDMLGVQTHSKMGSDQAARGLEWMAYNTKHTHSGSVTVGTIRPQRFWEGSFEEQDER